MAIERVITKEQVKSGRLLLENRENLTLSGVEDVLDFSESEVLLDTALGMLKVLGSSLKIISISKEEKTAELVGRINALEYKKQHEKRAFGRAYLSNAHSCKL